MKDWKKTLVKPSDPIIEVIKIIDSGALQIALVVDEDRRLLGTVTDGDVRQAILRQLSLQEPVEKIMCTSCTVSSIHDDREKTLSIMRQKELRHIPIVDDSGRVMDLKILMDIVKPQVRENLVILMAGGLGTRLKPLTNDCPKSLLKVGGKPILEIILDNFIEYGFHRFLISVNYKAEMIEDHFGGGSKWDVEIRYLRENKQLGTAGALSLLSERPTQPFFVMNGDLLTKVNFQQLLDFHNQYQGQTTMAVREYDFQVPYGVVEVRKSQLVGINEKPVHRFFVNAGIYVLEPEVLDLVPRNQFFNMTDLFDRALERNFRTAMFPVREYWLDIGQIQDLERANGEFIKILDE